VKSYEAQVFQKAIEIALHAVAPYAQTFDGILDKLTARTKTAPLRREYTPQDWAKDFLDCLPGNAEGQRLLMVLYLEVYVCGCDALHLEPGRCDDCGMFREPYRMTQTEAGRCGINVRHFWRRVQDRRLFGVGLKLVEK
jgi:hypothetical protein